MAVALPLQQCKQSEEGDSDQREDQRGPIEVPAEVGGGGAHLDEVVVARVFGVFVHAVPGGVRAGSYMPVLV